MESSDGDFLSSSDEYQPESDGDQSESDPGDQWGIVPGDQWRIVPGDESDIDPEVEWDETDDSELEWTDVKTEPGCGLVNMKYKVVSVALILYVDLYVDCLKVIAYIKNVVTVFFLGVRYCDLINNGNVWHQILMDFKNIQISRIIDSRLILTNTIVFHVFLLDEYCTGVH